ncbi:hypothetical protein GGQ22_08125 [Nocardioides sp. zg-579]|uniref:WXG100 family type VII secretion target n=1 Tax=Nocardioides marmotae TaxID=2663857 RepID=A0A6I3J6F0_9ACTN|nr:hypothetical protein [Nocardioides marmotae]MCR6031413.1 hypothetical protein [Gordonia jinghuaiqii]MTB95052.1 hypothetical protein [Nocardioides marmotae]QKE02451.1 hypothetical protein HPC71_16285 [Nocardioides marmotae]
MGIFGLEPSEMGAAAATSEGAAGDARSHDGSATLSTLGSALPGSTTAQTAPQLGTAWEDGVSGWADEVDDLAESTEKLTQDAKETDSGSRGFFELFRGHLGGGS